MRFFKYLFLFALSCISSFAYASSDLYIIQDIQAGSLNTACELLRNKINNDGSGFEYTKSNYVKTSDTSFTCEYIYKYGKKSHGGIIKKVPCVDGEESFLTWKLGKKLPLEACIQKCVHVAKPPMACVLIEEEGPDASCKTYVNTGVSCDQPEPDPDAAPPDCDMEENANNPDCLEPDDECDLAEPNCFPNEGQCDPAKQTCTTQPPTECDPTKENCDDPPPTECDPTKENCDDNGQCDPTKGPCGVNVDLKPVVDAVKQLEKTNKSGFESIKDGLSDILDFFKEPFTKPSDDPDLQTTEISAFENLDENLFGSSASCPADRTLNLTFLKRSISYSFSYQPLCDALHMLSFMLMSFAYLLGAYIVVSKS